MTTWKAAERSIGKIIGGTRVPVSGRQRGDAPDIRHEHLSVEVKHRKQLPAWIHDAMNQAQRSKLADQLPVVILHGRRMEYRHSMVMIRLDDFVEWYGEPWGEK